jgi:hypothetical protein
MDFLFTFCEVKGLNFESLCFTKYSSPGWVLWLGWREEMRSQMGVVGGLNCYLWFHHFAKQMFCEIAEWVW